MNFAWTTLVLTGLVFLLAPGFLRFWVLPDPPPARVLRGSRWMFWIGAPMLAAGTLGDVVGVVWTALGRLDPAMMVAYFTETRHGQVSMARLVLVAAFVAGWKLLPRPAVPPAWVLLGLGLIVTVSLTGHSAGEGGIALITADVLHLAAAAGWVGTVVGLALMPVWHNSPAPWLGQAMRRTSALGLAAVATIVLTGGYGVWVHFWSLPQVYGTPYGQALLLKLFLVTLILGLAALNRWMLVPRAEVAGWYPQLGWSIRIEAVLLILALVAAGYYVTRTPPGAPSSLLDAVQLEEDIGPYRIEAKFLPAEPGFELRLRIVDTEAAPVPPGFQVGLVLDMIDHRMVPLRPTLDRIGPGRYMARDVFTMPGRWQARLQLGEYTVVTFLDARP